MRNLCRPVFGFCFLIASAALFADHALLQDGRSALFNVIVEDTNTTWSRPLRVRNRSNSFRFDYDNNQLFYLRGHSEYHWVADYVKDTDDVDKKEQAQEFLRSHGWDRYTPPPRAVITPPTPTPMPIQTPVPVEVASPDEVATSTLPINQRVEEQLRMFIHDQTGLSDKIRLDQGLHLVDNAKAKQMRLKLLEKQHAILVHYYPQDNDLVRKAREALEDQIKVVQQSGRFQFEH